MKYFAWTLVLFLFANTTVSTLYFNYFDRDIGALQERFASHDHGDMGCSYDYTDNGAYVGTCDGGILRERDTLLAAKHLAALGSWSDDHSGIIFDHTTFQLYFYKFWEW